MQGRTAVTETGDEQLARDFVVASQPIFSKNLDVFAHELLFRRCTDDEHAEITDFNEATNTVIADGFYLASKRFKPTDKVNVNVGFESIMSGNVLALPSDRVILELPSDIGASAEFLDACKDIKKKGYGFLLDNFSRDTSATRELIPLMDYVKIPAGEMKGRDVAGIRKGFSAWNGELIASRIEDWETFEGCKALGFKYFQGFFFSYPQDIVGKKLTSHKASRLNLLRVLSDEEGDMSRIVDIISTDQALSVRLLQFVNSAAFGMSDKVDSLSRAASLVGLNTLRKWAMAAALSDIDTSGKGGELSYRTLHGAMFLSLLAEYDRSGGHEKETLALLGLLSNVDALMGMKMKTLMEDMPLKSTVKRALLREAKEPLSRYLMLLDAIWRNDWTGAQALLNGVGIPLNKGAKLYMQADEQAQELLESIARPL